MLNYVAMQALVYFAVSKKGETPIDGKTDANPEGLTAVTGKHAHAFAARLAAGDLSCKVPTSQGCGNHQSNLPSVRAYMQTLTYCE